MTTAEERLIADRAGTLELLASLRRDWDGVVEASAQSNVDDEHDPEGATIAFERARIEASLNRAEARLAESGDSAVSRWARAIATAQALEIDRLLEIEARLPAG